MQKLSTNCKGLCRYLVGNLQASSRVDGWIDIEVRVWFFHQRIAGCRMWYDTHGGSDGCRNPLSLNTLGGILGGTKVFSATGHNDFYSADALLRLLTDALIIVAVMAHIKVGSVEEMQTRVTSSDWQATITEVMKKCIPPTSVHCNRKQKTIKECDALLENAVLLLHHSLMDRALGEAVAWGDSGRIVKHLQMIAMMFHGRRRSNYATNSLAWYTAMLKTWSDDRKRVWLNHCMVNHSEWEAKWIEMDWSNVQLVCYIKEVYNPCGTPASYRFQHGIVARWMMIFRRAKLAMARATGAPDYRTHHGEMSAQVDIRRLIEHLHSENIYYS